MVNGSARTYLQDAVITQRNGRYCIPVKAEYRSQVPGMIHDQSSTGSTLFVEPMAVVKLNNDLKELYLKEQEEIEHVLEALSNQTAFCTEELDQDYDILTTLDFIFAKAKLAKNMKATRPRFNEKGRSILRKAVTRCWIRRRWSLSPSVWDRTMICSSSPVLIPAVKRYP